MMNWGNNPTERLTESVSELIRHNHTAEDETLSHSERLDARADAAGCRLRIEEIISESN